MKYCLILLSLFALIGCGGSPKPQVAVPPDADLKADVMMKGTGSKRAVEVSFYFSRPVAPGVKTEPKIDVIPVEEARFNDVLLTGTVNDVGRNIYSGPDLQIKAENLITIKLNGKTYEGRAIPQTTLESKSVTAVMTPK